LSSEIEKCISFRCLSVASANSTTVELSRIASPSEI
jgi:hypothetical protein